MSVPTLILASSSPRRRDILGSMGFEFAVRSVPVDEQRLAGEPATEMVLRLARAKAEAAGCQAGERVLGADTAVVMDGTVFGKPADEADALRMLGSLSGRTHQVVTGVAVSHAGRLATAVSQTDVRFREIDPDEARDYWHSGEPRGKAGAYAIQGLGGVFVAAISGSYSGVVGLPVYETAALLRQAGLTVLRGDN